MVFRICSGQRAAWPERFITPPACLPSLHDEPVNVLLVHLFGDEGDNNQYHEIKHEALDTGVDIAEGRDDLGDDAVVVNDTGQQTANRSGFGGPGPEKGSRHMANPSTDTRTAEKKAP
jgi:hypothetical protein